MALRQLGTKGSRRAGEHPITQGTRVLKGHLGTLALKALGHLRHSKHLSTGAIRHLVTWALEALQALYLADFILC